MNRSVFLFTAVIVLVVFCIPATAQTILPEDLKKLQLIDDSLGDYGSKILDEPQPVNRLKADSMFTRTLVRALRVPNSFYFSFDSMQTAPVVYPDDSTFRIITWHYTLNDADYHQRGVIQMKTPDGSLKIFPLYDYSDSTENPLDSIRTPHNWIGAVYYRIIQKTANGQPVYTLLGYDENNNRTTRKWMENLSFNKNGEPRFGGAFPEGGDSAAAPVMHHRFMMEYKKQSSAKLNYDPEEDLIIMDHLVSENNHPEDKSTMVPGGDYEAFKWIGGRWVNDPKLYTQMLGDGNEPREKTILDDNGAADETKLMEQSEKNMNKKKPPVKPAPAKPVKKQKS
jgi:hypothetical protein